MVPLLLIQSSTNMLGIKFYAHHSGHAKATLALLLLFESTRKVNADSDEGDKGVWKKNPFAEIAQPSNLSSCIIKKYVHLDHNQREICMHVLLFIRVFVYVVAE